LLAVETGDGTLWQGPTDECTVWEIESNANGVKSEHPTQKPVECMQRPIRNHQGSVYDPFMGSGTTLLAADREDRTFCGAEVDPKYLAVALERCSNTGLDVNLIED
jgi:DNA modification methylase